MDKEDYVSLEVAKMLKEKGFDIPVYSQYNSRGSVWACNEPENFNDSAADCYSRPALYEAQKWLRNNHQIHVDVGMCGDYSTDADGEICDEWTFWSFNILYTTNMRQVSEYIEEYDTYEEALNAGILEALKLI